MVFSRQVYWSGLPFPSPGDCPNPGIEPGSPVLQADPLPSEPSGKPTSEGRVDKYFIPEGKERREREAGDAGEEAKGEWPGPGTGVGGSTGGQVQGGERRDCSHPGGSAKERGPREERQVSVRGPPGRMPGTRPVIR